MVKSGKDTERKNISNGKSNKLHDLFILSFFPPSLFIRSTCFPFLPQPFSPSSSSSSSISLSFDISPSMQRRERNELKRATFSLPRKNCVELVETFLTLSSLLHLSVPLSTHCDYSSLDDSLWERMIKTSTFGYEDWEGFKIQMSKRGWNWMRLVFPLSPKVSLISIHLFHPLFHLLSLIFPSHLWLLFIITNFYLPRLNPLSLSITSAFQSSKCPYFPFWDRHKKRMEQ